MVFCYKSLLSSPARSKSCSPVRRLSPRRAISSLDLSPSPGCRSQVGLELDDIPSHDWRILEALARKREEELIRSQLAEQFHKLWEKEQNIRKKLDKQNDSQYHKYLSEKREWQARELEMRRLEKEKEEMKRLNELANKLKRKEKKSEEILKIMDYLKYSRLKDQNEDMTVRGLLATTARTSVESWHNFCKKKSVAITKKRTRAAQQRRDEILDELRARVAISTNLCQLETSLARQELRMLELLRMDQLRSHLARKEARLTQHQLKQAEHLHRSRAMAKLTATLREQLR